MTVSSCSNLLVGFFWLLLFLKEGFMYPRLNILLSLTSKSKSLSQQPWVYVLQLYLPKLRLGCTRDIKTGATLVFGKHSTN